MHRKSITLFQSLRFRLIASVVSIEIIMLSLLVFIFEGVRDAFDPRKTFQ